MTQDGVPELMLIWLYPKGYSSFQKALQVIAEDMVQKLQVAAIRNISLMVLDPNDFIVLNCFVKGHASLSPPSL
ncbi:hypothetical protein TNCV_3466671 [Trichonephila clavipes]|nr:hypothetical protein TNCV_3466671 [Trichonephila clavipes]